MCGLAGVWGGRDELVVRDMMDRLAHRGPDASGVHRAPDGAGFLGHRRLAIMDPAGGGQPIYDEQGKRAIVANGEVYNFRSLRRMLEENHNFTTQSDSEAVLHLYEDRGPSAAADLEGMFAFAIADGKEIYLARDPIGIKPLYYGRRDGCLCFGSEIKALAGIAEDIREFPPGHFFHPRTGFRSYCEVPRPAPRARPIEEHLRRIRKSLDRAVTKRLMSDVPLGCFLSGGLDSSIITYLARRQLGELHTFSVGFEGSADLGAAQAVARHLRTEHHELVLSEDAVAEALPGILHMLESFDQDLVRSAVPCYFVSRLAAQWVKVVLTGEGADELFAGYTYYEGYDSPEQLNDELHRSLRSLHNVNLQRVDRMTMAHGLEARVPFLDLDVVEAAMEIPADWKRRGRGRMEKWLLRRAFPEVLPGELLWRKKEQFDEGSGTSAILERLTTRWMTPSEAIRYARRHGEARLRSLEECVYHRLLCEQYSDPAPVLENTARWADRSSQPRGGPPR